MGASEDAEFPVCDVARHTARDARTARPPGARAAARRRPAPLAGPASPVGHAETVRVIPAEQFGQDALLAPEQEPHDVSHRPHLPGHPGSTTCLPLTI